MNGPATPRSARTAQTQREETDDASGGPKTTRNWQELMQELRVTQTGVQILTGFLLTVPFSQRFTQLNHHQRTAYFVVLVSCVLQTVFLVAPVAFHRVLFHQRQRPWLVAAGHVCAVMGSTEYEALAEEMELRLKHFEKLFGAARGLANRPKIAANE